MTSLRSAAIARFLVRQSLFASGRAPALFTPSCTRPLLHLAHAASPQRCPLRSFTTSEPLVCSRPSSCCGDCKAGNGTPSAAAAAAAASGSAGCVDGSYECWKCRHNVLNSMFCKSCGCVQSLECCLQKTANSFAVFDMEPTFDVDADALEAAFKNLQRRVHPDSFYSKSRIEAEFALQHASLINVSYQTLRNVSTRAIHLLQLLGHPLTENDRLTDLEFLSDVMEVQEDLASCDVAALRAHAQRNGDSMKQQRALASQAFASGRIAEAKAVVIKLQYLNNIQAALEQRLHESE